MLTFSNFFCGNNIDGQQRLGHDTFFLSNSTYNAGLNRIIFLDTRNGEFGLQVSQTPESGDMMILVDIGGNLKLEPVRVLGLNKLFSATNTQFLLNKRYGVYRLIYVNSDIGWIYDIDYLDTTGSDNPISDEYIQTLIENILNTTEFINVLQDIINNTNIIVNADKLQVPRLISLIGPVTGSVSFDGSQNVSIPTTITTNYVKTINTVGPDENGNITISLGSGETQFTAGNGIQIDDSNVISLTTSAYNAITTFLNNVYVKTVNSVSPDVNGNVVISTGNSYTAGNGIQIDDSNVISLTTSAYDAITTFLNNVYVKTVNGVSPNSNGQVTIPVGNTYTAGTGINISGSNVISLINQVVNNLSNGKLYYLANC